MPQTTPDPSLAVVERRVLDASVDEVWAALTDPVLLSLWLGDEVELDPQTGGRVRVRTADGSQRAGTVAEVRDGELLRFSWEREDGVETEVTFAVAASAEGTELVVREQATGAVPQLSAAGAVLSAAGWVASLAMLAVLLATHVLRAAHVAG